MNKKERKLIRNFFSHFCISQAIPRVNEGLALKSLSLPRPILDLGCGDGRFARLVFGQKGIEVGLDRNGREAERAIKNGAYQKVVIADAGQMPFGDKKFTCVVSNSVLEHVLDLDKVLKESARVLKRGGLLAASVPTPLVSKYQFWRKFIPGYSEFKEKVWRHRNYFGLVKWRQRLKKAGFKLCQVKITNSREAILWADVFFPIFWLGPIKKAADFLQKKGIFGLDEKGATLILIAEKK